MAFPLQLQQRFVVEAFAGVAKDQWLRFPIGAGQAQQGPGPGLAPWTNLSRPVLAKIQGGPCWKEPDWCHTLLWEFRSHLGGGAPALPPSLGITQDGASRCIREEIHKMPLRTVHRRHLTAAWTLVPSTQTPERIAPKGRAGHPKLIS